MKSDFARMNVKYNTYVQISLLAFMKYRECKSLLIKKKELDDDDKFHNYDIRNEMDMEYIKCIVFSAMTIEAFLFDISAIEFGDDFANNHLDKLSPLDKWAIIKMIIDKEYIQKDKEIYGLLTELFRTRNYLVHSKTVDFPFNENGIDIDKYQKILEKNRKYSIDIIKAVKVLFLFNKEVQELKCANHSFPHIVRYSSNIDHLDLYDDLEKKVQEIVFK
jgi:hypothetical protein